MNSQEREALILFLQQMSQAQAGQKDPEAQALIQAAMARQPDAGYLLVQRSMQFDILLQQAQARLIEMQAEIDRLKKPVEPKAEGSSFLGDLHAWGRGSAATVAAAPGVPSATATGAAPVNQTLRASAAPAQAAQPAPSTWGSGLLGTVATTAAGVVAGSFLYHGIQNLMGHSSSGTSQAGHDTGSTDWNTPVQNSTSGAVHTAYADTGAGFDGISDSSSGMDGGGDGGDGGGDGGGE